MNAPRDPPHPNEALILATSPSELPGTGVAGTPSTLPSPGVGLAGARFPGSPSLPDWDAASLSTVLSRMAQELGLGGVGVGGGGAPPASGVVVGGAEPQAMGSPGAAPVPSTTLAPAPAPPAPVAPATTSASPFLVEPSFDALPGFGGAAFAPAFAPDPIEALRFPLVDVVDAAAPSQAPAPVDAAQLPARSELSELSLDRAGVHALDPVLDARLLPTPSTSGGFDAYALRKEFPILEERVHGGKRLVWLDNAATTQKPRAVIERIKHFYEHENSNIHRAAHALAARATDAYEAAREAVRRSLNAPSTKEIVFVRGATEGINLIAQTWGKKNVGAGDEILITWLEHHANIVPWQMLCQQTGAVLKVAPVDDTGQIVLSEYQRLLSNKTRLVALPQVSNALGTITPAAEMIELAHRVGARVLLDGAQSISHMRVDVQRLGCDFFVFSGHKVFAPTGIGAVFGKAALLDDMPPWQGGGNMIEDVTFEQTRYQGPPARFEAGTGNIADAVGLGAALDWLQRVGVENVERHEHDLLVYGTERLLRVPGLRMIGTAAHKAAVLSFTLAGHSTHDVSAYLDQQGIAVRGGHHCAQPILRRFGVESTVRASLAPYNVCEDLDALVDALLRLIAGAR